jgi:Cytochrome c oxidase subunit IV
VTDQTVGTGHTGRRPTDDRKVPWRVFAVIGGILTVMGVIYWIASYEEAGIVMLLVAAILVFWVGGYLWLHERGPAEPPPLPATTAPPSTAPPSTAPPSSATAEPRPVPAGTATPTSPAPTAAAAAEAHAEAYLPHASIWPFAIGLGAAGVGVGMAIGLWVLIPGLGIMALGIGGFVRQTRRRD